MANALHQLNSPAEIVENLPKVWKVLIELLSHQNPPLSALKEGEKDPCYKSVETPTGPKLKLSVSQTFIRLKVNNRLKHLARIEFGPQSIIGVALIELCLPSDCKTVFSC